MAKITDIALQKKNPKRVNVFLDDNFAFGVSLDLRFEKKLEIGKNLTEKQTSSLVEADQVERMLNKSLKFLSFRPRSEKEIRDHLLWKGKLKDVDKSDSEKAEYEKSVGKVISKLKKIGQVEDKGFAEWWIEQRQKFKQIGSRAIKVELFQKGIDKDIISELLDESDETKEIEQATKAASKKIQSYNKLDPQEFRIKMGQYLARRGFGWNTIKKVVDTLLQNR